ncbi:cell wall hydrolase [Vagococcus lutrae]|uniref:CD1108 family mobile element protein n=1 Tax=Vagococcus lutrae TaxID=81947 RepID=UPI00192654C6|nr:C40 family peptidase [Vagococcus lutrae]UQF71656.1 NlpC/P60 family protein [Vagococcus lutrae]GEQ61685.1 cell wall hydrolase [Vagococcus lutrae]GEQ63186.1 cell wall hydrolase [Vagococcus lutrae]GEQ65078.1 cell wall hydrolase [Vagococcus lutrae]
MSKKRKKSFDEKLRLSKEKQNQDGSKIVNEDSKLKHRDDYRGKIIKDNEHFQDKFQESKSKRYALEVNDKGGQLSNRRYKLAEEKTQHQEEVQSFNYDSNSKDFKAYEGVIDKSKSNRNIRPKTDSQVKTEESVFYSPDSKKLDSNLKSTESKKTKLRKQAETFRKEEEFKYKISEESDVYDPLVQDTDNDGISDRYDNNFKDSDYFESTYDVEDTIRQEQVNQQNNYSPTSKKEKNRKIAMNFRKYQDNFKSSKYFESTFDVKEQKLETKDFEKIKGKKKQNRKIDEDFRSNQTKKEIHKEGNKKKSFTNEGFTRSRGKKVKASTGKEAIRDRENKKRTLKEISKSDLKKESVASGVFLGVEKSQDLAKSYISTGSEDNVGVEGAEKTLDTGSKLVHQKQKSFNKRKVKEAYSLSENDYKLRQKKSKLDFRDELEKTKASDEYKKSRAYKKFQKRKQMKTCIKEKNHTRIQDRIKESLKELTISAKNFITRKSKTIIFAILSVIIMGTFFINFGGTSLSLMINTASSTLSTTYLSDQGVLSEVNQVFTSMEQELQDELSSLEDYYPGYDEYIVNKEGEVYHNTHELLAYITSRYGAIERVSDVKSALNELFKAMYQVTYKTEVEIRYRTETKTFINENGDEETAQVKVPYGYKKFIVNLKTRSMDSMVREIFADYPDNIIHYEALMANQGNMGDYFGNGIGDLSEIVFNPAFGNPGIAFDNATTKKIFNEAEKHIGKRYVFGANGPSNFDCSSFVCWSFTHSGVKNMPRTTAYRIFTDYCNPVSPSEARAGDIIFFRGTYNSGTPISHVGIYAGNGMMIHAGDPIQYTSINTNYWKNHFYSFGRLR